MNYPKGCCNVCTFKHSIESSSEQKEIDKTKFSIEKTTIFSSHTSSIIAIDNVIHTSTNDKKIDFNVQRF